MTELQRNVTDPKLFLFDETELDEKKRYRQEKARKNINKRLKDINEKYSQDFGINAVLNDIQTLKELLFIKGTATELEWEDVWLMVADRSIKGLEEKSEQLNNELVARRARKNLIVPGRNN